MRQMALVCAMVAVVGLSTPVEATGSEQWQQVDEAVKKGLPKTAIEHLDQIHTRAIEGKAYAEATKAIGMKIALEGVEPEEKVLRLQAEMEKAPAQMRPAMEAILAHWYWQYFQRNRWRFIQRTQTAQTPGPDIQTWDLARILAVIDRHFTLALADEQTLKATPISAYDGLLDKGSLPDTYRPTMYDFLCHEALQFYCMGEQGAVEAEDTFVLNADGPIFAQVAEFLKWRPETPDPNSPTVKAVRLYQSLLTFHQNDLDKTAFVDADLGRLIFGKNKAMGEDKDDRYKAALGRFVDKWADHEVSARALYEWAQVLEDQDDSAGAHKLADRGLKAFPESVGGALCYNLIQEIESRFVSIETERVWNDPLPEIRVTYRNITRVHFRAVPIDYVPYMESRNWDSPNADDEHRRFLLAAKPSLQWEADLPPTQDYWNRTEALPAPKGLKPGFYFILASHDPQFSQEDNQICTAPIWVSDLALVMREREGKGVAEGLVVSALTGEPVAGARVRVWMLDTGRRLRRDGETRTDENGLFRIGRLDERHRDILVEYNGQQLDSEEEVSFGHNRSRDSGTQTVFFTDRSLYRPGQTICYKGICLSCDRDAGRYQALAGQRVTVIVKDTNRKEVARVQHRCNDYGAFSGSFTAPRDRGTGQMEISVDSGPEGRAWLSVEEYKRPKFQVELTAPEDAPRLGAEVSLTGKATAYTGAAIGNAKVSWRVKREVRWPLWWSYHHWGRSPRHSQSQAIAHGTVITETDGTFTIPFVARPDPAVSEKDEPTFEFTVYADVTDSTGETRSGQRTVRAGYTALQATLDASPWQTVDQPVELKVETRSLDGEPQPAKGTMKVYGLRQPPQVIRAALASKYRPMDIESGQEPEPDPADPNSWELGEVAADISFQTDANGVAKASVPLKVGIYRAMLETQDRFGKPASDRLPLQVVDLKAKSFQVKVPNHLVASQWSLEPGQTLKALWGTGYDKGRALVEIECNNKVLRRYWTGADRTQEIIEQQVTEAMRGGFTLHVTYVRENRAYLNKRIVDVPWTNKKLTVKWEHFRSLLTPGGSQSWTAVVTGPDSHKAVAEMVAGMYDASLDQYLPHEWHKALDVFRWERDYMGMDMNFMNSPMPFQNLVSDWREDRRDVDLQYRAFPPEIEMGMWWAYRSGIASQIRHLKAQESLSADARRGAVRDGSLWRYRVEGLQFEGTTSYATALAPSVLGGGAMGMGGEPDLVEDRERTPDLSQVSARRNLQETAFFYPHLMSDANGVVRIEFTMPEALTTWRFMGLAHDKELRSGFLTDTAVTAKDLMVQPNPPRFVREGDVIEFTVKVSNRSDARQTGKVSLTFADARTLESRDAALANLSKEQPFDVPAKESRGYSWRLTIPDGCEFLTYKAVAATDQVSDGEEGPLPVLSRRVLMTESLPLPIRGPQTKEFEFTKLLGSAQSQTLRHQSLTVQMVSQPAWYAVMALPYLMEYPHECSEQVFNRFYANALAGHIAKSDPKIRRIFDLWKATPTLDSPLEKNEDLKSVALEETPWYRQAQSESQARRNVGVLFDENRLNDESGRSLRRLHEMQLEDGLWPWFPGNRGNEYITLYIVTGFGRLRHLGIQDVDVTCATKALAALDTWMDRQYRSIIRDTKADKDRNHLTHTIAFYLYGRSFFLSDRPIDPKHKEALDYWLGQARRYWLDLGCRQSQAHLAIGLNRFGDKDTSAAIMRSLKERSVTSEKMGMYWQDAERTWWWYHAPIETQAVMIEAFDEVAGDAKAVEDCKVWLLKQKQTQDWRTTKATADAVYGLLMRGTSLLVSDALVEVDLAGQAIRPEKVEAGTGFYEKRLARDEVRPAMGRITVKKTDDGVSWGSVHWQYLEDLSKVTPYEGTPLQLKKALFIKEATDKGQVLKPVTGAVHVGDELVVRIVLHADRDMEYVHMKDQRGSGTEPVNVLSQYRYQDGLGYYESTRDTATHFFMEYLRAGTYVFEYSTRVQLKGRYQTGIATIQCMYAPEFNSHSEGFELEVE